MISDLLLDNTTIINPHLPPHLIITVNHPPPHMAFTVHPLAHTWLFQPTHLPPHMTITANYCLYIYKFEVQSVGYTKLNNTHRKKECFISKEKIPH